jgi:raffinose/stachyose/melibiose transport system permease protein
MKRTADLRVAILFIAPALLFYLILMLVPTVGSVWISLHEWKGIGDTPSWVGLGNYSALLNDSAFRTSMGNTLFILVIGGFFVFSFSLVFTAILKDARNKAFLRAVIFFPILLPPVAVAIVFGVMLAPNGLINGLLEAVGLESWQVVWLSPNLIFKSITAGVVWIHVGFIATILLAGVDRIPRSLYEAAEIDGATLFQQFRYITLPLIWDVVGIVAILWIIVSIKIFEFVYSLAGSGTDPSVASWTLGVHMYLVALAARSPVFALGTGSAIATIMLILVAVAVVIVRRIFRRDVVYF